MVLPERKLEVHGDSSDVRAILPTLRKAVVAGFLPHGINQLLDELTARADR